MMDDIAQTDGANAADEANQAETVDAGTSTAGHDPEAVVKLAADADAAKARVDELTAQVSTLEQEKGALSDQLDAAKTRIAELEKTLAEKPKGKVGKAAEPAKPRKAGPLADGKAVTGDALVELLAAADAADVEIVFSDGSREIAGVPPVAVAGDVWRQHPRGLMLREPVVIEGAPQPTQLRGYALFVDGKQVAFTPRDAVALAPGQSVNLENDIYFA